uniref:Respiratory burst oxidase-like protein n=1 Tax=Chondrus crispus TaxID=2769 RepID=Q2FA46_CHOCR|nr:respiratory burst oxidase-like protein [Chondrus crispus]
MIPRSKPDVARPSARIEAYLSTHAFKVLFFAFYGAAVTLMFAWGFKAEFTFEDNFDMPHFNTVRWFIGIARGMGYTLNLNTAFVILLASRLLFTKLRDSPLQLVLPFDAAFPALHIVVGYTIFFAVLVHGSFHFVWLITWDAWTWGLWSFNMSVITGFLLAIVFGTMLVLARPSVRKNNFRLFYAVHIIGATLFFGLLIIHGMFRQVPYTYKWVIPPLILYAIDRFLRRRKVSAVELFLSAENAVLKDGDILELRVPKAFSYQAGQYAEVQVPFINREWHPFTIASAPQDKTMCFYIKALGDWTKELRGAFQARVDGAVTDSLQVNIRGPYGAPAQHVGLYERVVLISGGIGSTPFTSICKDLHHRKVKENATSATGFEPSTSTLLKRIESRVSTAISTLYGVDISNAKDINQEEEEKRVYLANMLNLTAPGSGSSSGETTELEVEMVDASKQADESSSDSDRSTSMESYNVKNMLRKEQDEEYILDDIKNSANARRGNRERLSHLYEGRSKVLEFLHTSRVNLLLLFVLIARIFFICISSIIKADYIMINAEPHAIESGLWIVIVDTVLSIIFAIVLPLTIFLELSYMGSRFFRTVGRTLDFFVFLPLTITSASLGIKALVTERTDEQIVLFLHYIVFLPTLFVLLAVRMYRALGKRTLLTDAPCHCSHRDIVPNVDFVWTVPHENDDEWLRSELEPLADGTELKLHRYVTRAKEVDMEAGSEFITSSNTGRPEWDEIFGKIAAEAPSNSVVGVFFCGPHKMGDSVQSAMRRAEINSNLRGAYLRSTKEKTLMKDLGLPQRGLIKMLMGTGCSVRFVFREENFG